MKKFICCAMLATLTLALAAPVAAAVTPQTIDAGQSTWEINQVTTVPTLDGSVSAGEYPTVRRWNVGDPGTVNNLKNDATFGYIDISMGYDDQYLYLGAVVQEDEYAKKASGSYSNFLFHLGCDMKDDMISAQKYIEATLAINEDGSEFGGISVISYDENGTQAKSWSYMSRLNAKMKFSRGTDGDGKAITTYEIHIPFDVIMEAYGLEKIDTKAWFNFTVNNVSANRVANGNLGWYNPLTDDQQADLMIEFNFSPKSLFNFIAFSGTASAETTAAPVETTAAPVETTAAPVVTTAAPVVTTAPAGTTAAPVTTPATADTGIVLAACVLMGAAALLALRRRKTN